MIWTYGLPELEKFISHLNQAHPTLKFTHSISQTQMSFLDILVIKDGPTLHIDLYIKPTDTHMYLHYGSCHPKHSKTGGPYSQLLRVRRICSRLPDFHRHATDILFHYAKRGYPATLFEEKLHLVVRKDRHTLLHPPPPPLSGEASEQDPLFCVVTYHPRHPPILQTLNDNWKILECTPTLKCISQKTVKTGFHRSPNLRDLLVHSRITYPPSTNTGTPSLPNPNKVCSKTDCDYYPLLNKSGTCFSPITTHKYIVLSRISCKLNNLSLLVDLHTLPTPICRRNLPQSQRETDWTSSRHRSWMQSPVCTTFCHPEGPLHCVSTLW